MLVVPAREEFAVYTDPADCFRRVMSLPLGRGAADEHEACWYPRRGSGARERLDEQRNPRDGGESSFFFQAEDGIRDLRQVLKLAGEPRRPTGVDAVEDTV